MELTGIQLKQLHGALVKAFPTVASLSRLVETEMEENLAAIVLGTSLDDIVFNLIVWARAGGRLEELVEKAYQEKPGNPELRAFAVQVGGLPIISVKKTGNVKSAPSVSLTDMTESVVGALKSFATGGFRKNYLKHLGFRHRTFDVKGLSTTGPFALELERVFVELSIFSPPEKISNDPIRDTSKLPGLPKERHSVWTYLQTNGIRHLAIVGAPGSGKTTLLKHMALTLASGKTQCKKEGAPFKIPILLFLRDHADKIAPRDTQGQLLPGHDYTLEQAVKDTLKRFEGPMPPDGWLARELAGGHCLVLLDGLDEVADLEARKMVVAWVEKQLTAHGDNLFVIASRPFGYQSNPLAGVSVLEILPFSRTQQEQFVRNWYLANEIMSYQKEDEGVRMEAREGANDLLRRIRSNNALSDLAVNPLLLTMIATVHRYRNSLPERRVELYAEICEVFLGKRRAATGLTEDLTPLQKQRVLQPLAYEMMRLETREMSQEEAAMVIAEALQQASVRAKPDVFLKAIEDSSGLLIEREKGVYSFSHLTFQEFLASVHLQERKLDATLEMQVHNAWWHEVIRLYCARGVDVTSLIYRCLSPDTKTVFTVALAVECIADIGKGSKLGAQVEDMLNAQIEHEQQDIRHDAALTLLTIRERQLVRLDGDRFVDNGLISQGEYQYFLDMQREQGKYYQPDHWEGTRFLPGEGRYPVVGVRPLDAVAFCDWLTEKEGGEWRYRLPKIGELARESLLESATMGKPVGYWTVQEKKAKCFIGDLKAPVLTAEMLKKQFILDHSLALDLALTLDHDLPLAHALELARARTPDLGHDLTHNLGLGLALALDLDLGLDLDRAHARTLDLDLDHDLVSALEIASGLELARDLGDGLDLDLAHTLALARALARTLERDRTSELIHDRALRRSACYYLASITHSWARRHEKSGRKFRDKGVALKRIAKDYLYLYVYWGVVEKRIEGELLAWEGIRIIKERVKEA